MADAVQCWFLLVRKDMNHRTNIPTILLEGQSGTHGSKTKTMDSSYKLYKHMALKNYFSTSNIKSFVRSAITLSVISTLELFEAVTDGRKTMPSFPAGVHLGYRGGLRTCSKGGNGKGDWGYETGADVRGLAEK